MSIATMILGASGTGKTASLRTMDGADVFLIQAVAKPLPFKAQNWTPWVCDDSAKIVAAMSSPKMTKNIIVIDDFQYIMANEFMRRVLDKETGNAAFAKYNEIAHNVWSILNCAMTLGKDKRVYILSHTDTDEAGKTQIKTIGKLLNEKICLEGLITNVMRSHRINGSYVFSTQNSGNDTVKTAMGMFEDEHIPNDLNAVDTAICQYYDIAKNLPTTKE